MFFVHKLYLLYKPKSMTHAHIGAMYTTPEVDFVVLFDYNEHKAKAFDEAFKWIKPTLCPIPTIEEGPAEWKNLDDVCFGNFYGMGTVYRPVTVSFEQEQPMNQWIMKRTEEYKLMLYFIHHGFKEHKLFVGKDENLKTFLLRFFNEHTDHEEYEILLNIIFVLAEGKVIDLHEVVDAICEIENKEVLVVLLKKADEMDYYKYKGQPKGRFNL